MSSLYVIQYHTAFVFLGLCQSKSLNCLKLAVALYTSPSFMLVTTSHLLFATSHLINVLVVEEQEGNGVDKEAFCQDFQELGPLRGDSEVRFSWRTNPQFS